MNKNYFIIFLTLISALIMLFTACGSINDDVNKALDIDNLLEYSIETSDSTYSPKQVEFYMTVYEVLQAKGLNSDAVSEDESLGKRIINTVNVSNLSEAMTEVYSFSEDKLV